MKYLTDQELRDLLRILTINRARMELDNPSLLVRSTGAHLELCERIRLIKSELDMGYGETSWNRIENGRCVGCGQTRVSGRVKCDECVLSERIHFRQRKLAEMATSPAMHKRLVRLWEYLGIEASPEHVRAAYELERRDKVRWIFFRWLFDSRKANTARDFGDYEDQRQVFGNAVKDLIADALQYAATVPDPLKEIQEWQLKREIETRGRTPLAIAMARYDGMTAEDFEVVRPLYA